MIEGSEGKEEFQVVDMAQFQRKRQAIRDKYARIIEKMKEELRQSREEARLQSSMPPATAEHTQNAHKFLPYRWLVGLFSYARQCLQPPLPHQYQHVPEQEHQLRFSKPTMLQKSEKQD